MKKMKRPLIPLLALALLLIGVGNAAYGKDAPFTFGLLLVGPYNDKGYSQAHYDGGRYVEQKVPNTRMIYIDKVNPADRPGVTISQLVEDMVEKGARLIIANSDDMKDGIREAALLHPDIYFIHCSGDDVLTGKAPKNLANLFGKMEYGKMMAGFAAAMTTKTGKIGYLGPLINEETRRLVSAAYIGARYAWETVLKKDPKALKFQVTWIGFWFNIPGITTDPTQVAHNFYNTGYDVVISGIDTTENLVVAGQKRKEGKSVWAIPYDYEGACQGADDVCLGVPYFNWGPAYAQKIQAIRSGAWKSDWLWLNPDWENINNLDTSAIGFNRGAALSAEVGQALDAFISGLGQQTIELFVGPLNYQDGSVFLKAGEKASDQKIWYMEQLLQGIDGQSSPK